MSALPDRLGRYAVRRRIGAGGFATVWLAYDEHLDSPVAVKVLADNWTEDHHIRTRFVEEGRYLRRVDSPHVVTVYDAGELADGRPYLVMTYADQGSLAERLETGVLDVAEAAEVVRQVGSGLQALHDRGILHRDVKPANVLFRSLPERAGNHGVRAMLGDLGLGKALDISSRLTMIAGSPSFVAPEQAQGEPPGATADQYSLAVITHLLLGGRMPWRHADLVAAASPGPAPRISGDDRQFPDDVEDVVRRALSPAPTERWPSVTAYVDALTDALGEETAPSGRGLPQWQAVDPELTQAGGRPSPEPENETLSPPKLPKRRRRLVSAVVAALALAAGGAAGYLLEPLSRPDDATVIDETGSLEVTVPIEWEQAVGDQQWTPPIDDGLGEYPALSVGTSARWNDPQADGEGVFLGLFAGDDLPDEMPQHPECEEAADPITEAGDNPSVTVLHSGCPGGVTMERVSLVAANRMLWVQVRSDDRATANQVLDSVETHGL